ncbi:MAG: polysaccharide deacetylase family protein [Candidatus Bathyarchaeota archaeon]|nr:polysaccharide deacetylase family protein [Candidatus Bathyarchaeota archaeon]
MKHFRPFYVALVILFFCGSLFCLPVVPTAKASSVPAWDFQDHSYNHPYLTSLTTPQIINEVTSMNAVFAQHGLPLPIVIAYPNGDYNQTVIDIVSQYRLIGRTAEGGLYFPEPYPVSDWYQLSSACITPNTTFANVQEWIDLAVQQKSLLNLYTHKVTDSPGEFDTTPAMLAQILDYLVLQQNAGNLAVLTVRDSYTQFTGQKAAVTFSFDDSYVTDFTVAYPMFIDRGIAGTCFIVGGIVDANIPSVYLNWTMVHTMAMGSGDESWAVSITSNPHEGGTTSPYGLVNVVSGTLTIAASPAAGYTFSYWIFDGNVLTANPLTLPAQVGGVTHNLTAYFTPSASTFIFQDGFESGGVSPTWWADGTPTIVTSPVHDGSYAARATGPNCDWAKQLSQSHGDLFFAGYVQLPALSLNGQSAVLLSMADAAWTCGVYGGCGVDSGGSYWLVRAFPSGTLYKTYDTIPANQWIFLELEYNTAGTARLWVNGELAILVTGETFSQGAQILQGGNPSGVQAGFVSYGDDYAAATGYISGQSPPPTYLVTVPAYDDYGEPVAATVSIDGGVVGSTGGTFTVPSGTHQIQVSVPTGYAFNNFTYNENTNTNNPATISVTSDMTVTANYLRVPASWSVSINSNPSVGGTTNPSGTIVVQSGNSLTVTANSTSGYSFSYWLFDGNNLTANPLAIPAQPVGTSHTLTAYFNQSTPSSFIFEDDFEGGTFSKWSGTTVGSGASLNVASSGAFQGAQCASASLPSDPWTYAYSYKQIDEQTVLYTRAYFKLSGTLPAVNAYSVLMNYEGSSAICYLNLPRTGGGALAIELASRNGATWDYTDYAYSYALDTWYCLELYAKIDSSDGAYGVWLNSNQIISLTDKNSAAYGPVTQVNVGAAGDEFGAAHQVYYDAVAMSSNYIGPLSSSGWSVNVSVNGAVGGTTNPSGLVNVPSGALTVSATPAVNYEFSHWQFDGAEITANPVILPEQTAGSTHTLVAFFTEVLSQSSWLVNIDVDGSEGGTTNPSGLVNVTSGSLTVTATAASGYSFSHWMFDGNNLTANPVTLPEQANQTSHTLTAYFIATTPSVIFQDDFEGGSFATWTGTSVGSGASLNVVDSGAVQGSNCAQASLPSDSWTYAYSYKQINGQTTLYTRAYFKLAGTLPAADTYCVALSYEGSSSICYLNLQRTGRGSLAIELASRNGVNWEYSDYM